MTNFSQAPRTDGGPRPVVLWLRRLLPSMLSVIMIIKPGARHPVAPGGIDTVGDLLFQAVRWPGWREG
jgi:hypothetical protein